MTAIDRYCDNVYFPWIFLGFVIMFIVAFIFMPEDLRGKVDRFMVRWKLK